MTSPARVPTHRACPAATGLACLLFALAASLAAQGCGNDSSASPSTQPAAEELRQSGFGDYLGVQAPSSSEASGQWTHLFFDPSLEQAVCLAGATYQVSFRHGKSDQVLLYLQGGGACWDHFSCYVARTATTTANGPVAIGSLDLDDPDSPFADYDVVYAPYCDGSVFTGDATVDYEGERTFHHGLRNLSVAIDAVKKEFPSAPRIVVAGSSAGGYGTFAGYAATRVAFPSTEIVVFNDSGPGLQNPDATEDVQSRVANWSFTARIPESCTECDTQYTYLLDWAFRRDGSLRTALYSYQEDQVIRGFLDLSGSGYRDLLLDVTGELVRRNPDRFKRFLPLGDGHTVLQSTSFYSQSIDGTTVRDWTQAFLDDAPGWTDLVE